MGIPVLLAVLQDDRDDLDLVRGALECLVAAMTPGGWRHGMGETGG
jgi:hypothetical protein